MLNAQCLIPKLLAAALLLQQAQPSPALKTATALKTTIRMNVAQVDSSMPMLADGSRSPYGNFGPLIKQLLTPAGPVTIDYVISGDQSRADVRSRLATLPEGSVVLQRMGEAVIRVLNPSNKTWYEIAANQNLGTLLGVPDVTIEPTGEQTTIAGQRAERFRFKETRRNCDFVELLDRDRGLTVRLYQNALFVKGVGFEDFTKYYDGRWVK